MTVIVLRQSPSIGYPGHRVAQSVGIGCMIESRGRDRCVVGGALQSPLPAALPLLKMTRLGSAASSSAEVAEWQTQRTQNPPCASTCGFKSRPRHQKITLQSLG